MFLVLVAAAIGTSILNFTYARKSEEDAFESEVDGVGGRLVDGMMADVSLSCGLAGLCRVRSPWLWKYWAALSLT